MDVYDSALTQSQPQNESGSKSDSQSTSQSTQQADAQQLNPQSPTLEHEVQQLVGGITSWWSGVSKKSQESIAQAQSHIQSQGGILNLARKELSHFEDQISQAQSKAREQSLKSQSPQKEKTTSDLDSNLEKDIKGKGKAKEEEEHLNAEESKENEIEISTNKTTTEIHDVNSPGGFNDGDSELKLDFEKSRELALKEARNAANFASGLFNRLANETGPRMAHLGKQLQDSLNKNLSLDNTTADSSASKEVGGDENSESSEKQQTKGNGLDLGQTLNSLTKTFQKSIPNLDLEKSQSLARKYLQASEKGLKEAGKEMNGLLNDLIKIVPEDGKTLEEHQQNSNNDSKPTSNQETPQVGGESKAQGKEKKEKEVEEEIFDWDNENEEGNKSERRDEKSKENQQQQQQVETTTRPETGNLSLDEKEKGSDGKPLKENQVEEDEDEDDDWE